MALDPEVKRLRAEVRRLKHQLAKEKDKVATAERFIKGVGEALGQTQQHYKRRIEHLERRLYEAGYG